MSASTATIVLPRSAPPRFERFMGTLTIKGPTAQHRVLTRTFNRELRFGRAALKRGNYEVARTHIDRAKSACAALETMEANRPS